eukprot:3357726-Amphidinium_carterae.1
MQMSPVNLRKSKRRVKLDSSGLKFHSHLSLQGAGLGKGLVDLTFDKENAPEVEDPAFLRE